MPSCYNLSWTFQDNSAYNTRLFPGNRPCTHDTTPKSNLVQMTYSCGNTCGEYLKLPSLNHSNYLARCSNAALLAKTSMRRFPAAVPLSKIRNGCRFNSLVSVHGGARGTLGRSAGSAGWFRVCCPCVHHFAESGAPFQPERENFIEILTTSTQIWQRCHIPIPSATPTPFTLFYGLHLTLVWSGWVRPEVDQHSLVFLFIHLSHHTHKSHTSKRKKKKSTINANYSLHVLGFSRVPMSVISAPMRAN